MPDASIRIEGLDKLVKKLDGLEGLKVVKAGIQAGALHVKGKIAKYPPRKKVTIAQAGGWASPRQRRWFFATYGKAIKEGVDISYRRGQSSGSEDLGQKWAIQELNGGLGAKVGNNVSYGPFVQGAETQSRMHKIIGWKTTDQVAEEEGDKVTDLVKDEIEKALNK